MTAEILLVSTPATLERDKETATKVARILVKNRIQVREQISVCTDRSSLQQSIATAIGRSELIVTIGGMGGAAGFLCKQVMSEGLRLPLVHNPKAHKGIQQYAQATRTPYYPEDVTFASLPQGSRPLLPRFGKQPGCIISATKQSVVMLPENAREASAMLSEQVLPTLPQTAAIGRSVHRIRTYGITEPQVRRMLVDLMGTTNPTITLHAEGEEMEIKVTAQAADQATATALTSPVLDTIVQRLGDYAYGLNVDSLEMALVQKMQRKNITLSVAEAGTTGTFASTLQQTNGGRPLVRYHLMAETNESKTRHLGIPSKMLRRQGDVSEYTAIAMAHGALVKGKSTLGVGICADIPGIAQNEKAQVFIAVCSEEEVYVKKLVLQEKGAGGSDAVIHAAVARALNMTRIFVDYYPESYHGSVPLEYALAAKENVTDQQAYETPETFAFHAEELDTPTVPEPRKEKKKRPKRKAGKVRRVITLLVVVAFLASGSYLGLQFYRATKALELRDDLAMVYATSKFMGLKAHNEDVVAYLSIDDTGVTYPIVQAENNEFYYRRNFHKENDNHGIPYMDKNVDVYKPSDNMVIYGHNMMDGQIFGELLNYRDLEYYKEHPVINFDTITYLDIAREGKYKIMSVFITNTYKKHGDIFNYHKWIDMNDEEFATYINQLELRSLITTTVDTKPGDELITLSTCDYNFSGSRFVVVARRVRPGESSQVDVEGAYRNPEPLLPDVWYNSFGGTRPSDEKIQAAGGVTGEANFDISSRVTMANKIAGISAPGGAYERELIAQREAQKINTSLSTGLPLQAAGKMLAKDMSLLLRPVTDKQQEEERKLEEASKAEEAEQASKAEQEQLKKQEKLAKEEAARQQELKKQQELEQQKQLAQQAEQEKQEKERQAQEAKAIEAEKLAQTQADKSLTAEEKALSSSTYAQARTYASDASSAATSAETAARDAKIASDLAGTTKASTAAVNAENYAKTARKAAGNAAETASLIQEEERQQEQEKEHSSGGSDTNFDHDLGTLKVNGREGDALDIVARIVQNEIGSSYHEEAIKAQAVAAYTFVAHANSRGNSASVVLASKADSKVIRIVQEVLGEAIYYGGSLAFTPYHATSSGSTTTSQSVWGGSYPYLVAVDSSVDEEARNFRVEKTMSADTVSDILSSKLGIDTYGDPEDWFEIISYEPGDYVGRMRICGETKSQNTGNTLTGRLVRESVFHLRSANFTIDYNSNRDEFTFTTYGYGHGVGMSQTGANFYAKQGWSYTDILGHYYPGTSVQ